MPSSIKQKVRNHSADRIGHFPLEWGWSKRGCTLKMAK